MFDLKNLALSLIVLGMLIGFGLLIMEQTKGMLATQIPCYQGVAQACENATNASAWRAVNTAETAIVTITSWLGIIVLVVMAALVMRYLLSAFSGGAGDGV